MSSEKKHFSFDDVVKAICEKMVRRHPHVFGSEQEIENGKQNWELMKKQERFNNGEDDESALAHISIGLSPLVRARKLQKKAAKVNFDWPNYEGVLDKLYEEMSELKQAIGSNQNNIIEEEMGDVLFSVVNLCRHLKIDADVALQQSNTKFENRFRAVEKLAIEQGSKVSNLEIDELEDLWRQVKSSNNMEKSTA